ncbi:hypothetical protein MTO96_005653 [Rhipicephalus appendiculatus]
MNSHLALKLFPLLGLATVDKGPMVKEFHHRQLVGDHHKDHRYCELQHRRQTKRQLVNFHSWRKLIWRSSGFECLISCMVPLFYKPFTLPGLRNAKWGTRPAASLAVLTGTSRLPLLPASTAASKYPIGEYLAWITHGPYAWLCSWWPYSYAQHKVAAMFVRGSIQVSELVFKCCPGSEVSGSPFLDRQRFFSLLEPHCILLMDLCSAICSALRNFPIFALGTCKGQSHWSSSPCSMEDYFPQEAVFHLPANTNRILVDLCFKMCTDSSCQARSGACSEQALGSLVYVVQPLPREFPRSSSQEYWISLLGGLQ